MRIVTEHAIGIHSTFSDVNFNQLVPTQRPNATLDIYLFILRKEKTINSHLRGKLRHFTQIKNMIRRQSES